jgi:hypothetical protein
MILFFTMAKRLTTRLATLNLCRCACLVAFLIGLPVATASAVSVTLEWDNDPHPELRGYKIFCRLSSDANYDYDKPVWAGTDGRCDITGLASKTDYCFVVRAFDADGNESGDSNEVFYPGSQVTSAQEPSDKTEPETPLDTPEPTPMSDGGGETPLDPVLNNTPQADTEDNATHQETHWQVFRDDGAQAQLCVYEAESDTALEQLHLPPLVLDEVTTYFWRSRYINGSGIGSEWAAPQYFTTGVQEGDSDGDGLLDAQVAAPDTDMNGDGIRDQTQMRIRPVKTVIGEGIIAVDAMDNDQIRAVEGIRSLDPADPDLGSEGGYDLPLGLVAFKISLADGAPGASVTLHLSHAPGEDMALLTFDTAKGWQSAADLAQLADGGNTALLTLTDGGSEDVDGVVNGLIVFTGGFGRPVDYHGTGGTVPGIKGEASVMGGASACFIGTAGR